MLFMAFADEMGGIAKDLLRYECRQESWALRQWQQQWQQRGVLASKSGFGLGQKQLDRKLICIKNDDDDDDDEDGDAQPGTVLLTGYCALAVVEANLKKKRLVCQLVLN